MLTLATLQITRLCLLHGLYCWYCALRNATKRCNRCHIWSHFILDHSTLLCVDIYIAERHALTQWGRVTHICVSKLTIIGSVNGLSPDRRQAIIWTNVGILLSGPLGTNFSEISIEILTFSFKKMRLKVSSAKRRLFCFGLNMLKARSWS